MLLCDVSDGNVFVFKGDAKVEYRKENSTANGQVCTNAKGDIFFFTLPHNVSVVEANTKKA